MPNTLDAVVRGLSPAQVDEIECHVQCRVGNMVRDFRMMIFGEGLVLRGRARSYYAKQLAQQAVMEATDVRIIANEIEVS